MNNDNDLNLHSMIKLSGGFAAVHIPQRQQFNFTFIIVVTLSTLLEVFRFDYAYENDSNYEFFIS